jgi:predicted Zn-dependent protease
MLAAALLLIAACATNPVTGERELALVSESQEIELGRQTAEQVQRSIGLVDNAALQDYVQRVGASLAAESQRPELPWTFRVVEDPTPNAFALPGGFIFITRGLLGYMDSEAELAAVLGHEIGHVTARHSVQQISRAQLAQLGLGLGMILVPEIQQFGDLLGSGLQLLFLKYGRDAERQADDLGFDYALRERIERVAARLLEVQSSVDELRLGRPEFMRLIDGLPFGENPRNGFFERSTFLHPDLAFRLDFPEGWRTQNLPQAVVAGSPQKDALIQLALAQAAPEEAARQFFAQQGVQAGQAVRDRVNGLPALLASFQAQTQQGVLRGVVGFIGYRDRTYQVIGFAPAARYPAMERTFLATIGSFAPLTDRKALDVQPRTIDVVEIPRAMSLAEFARSYPSTAEIETLALLNQVRDATTVMPAGTLVKRVIEQR